jgi:uncharacterized membrane-anchored protein YhcB (DUF1043 family)
MWLFYVETFIFVLVAFALGAAVGLSAVRLGVRRVAPAQVKQPKVPAEKKKGRKDKKKDEAAPAEEPSAAPTGTGGAA